MENDRFSSGGSRPLGLDALMPMKVLNLFIVLKLHRNLRFLINFEYYLIKNEYCNDFEKGRHQQDENYRIKRLCNLAKASAA